MIDMRLGQAHCGTLCGTLWCPWAGGLEWYKRAGWANSADEISKQRLSMVSASAPALTSFFRFSWWGFYITATEIKLGKLIKSLSWVSVPDLLSWHKILLTSNLGEKWFILVFVSMLIFTKGGRGGESRILNIHSQEQREMDTHLLILSWISPLIFFSVPKEWCCPQWAGSFLHQVRIKTIPCRHAYQPKLLGKALFTLCEGVFLY